MVVAAPTDPLLGEEIGQYVIESLLGEGAMGRVYRAHHKHLADRTYAVKVLLGDLASTQEMRMRFLNEARSASKLSHPNVVTVYDVGRTDGGLLYLVMELVEGTPLSHIIATGPMDAMVVAKLARGICDGLAHAHAHGIVHRDLKPDNVIVVSGPDGEQIPRIVDFGIAVSIDREDSRLTATGMAMGTPGYVAPEQVCGERVDASADQYALGVTMFEMLTGGRLPFHGTSIEVAAAKTAKDAPPISDSMPHGCTVPPALERMVERMLARKPADRYESVVGISRMLARWGHAPDTQVIAYPSPWPKRAMFAGLAVFLAAGGALAWTRLRSSHEDTPVRFASTIVGSGAPSPAVDEVAVEPDVSPGDPDESSAPSVPEQTPHKRPHRTSGRKTKDKHPESRVAAIAPLPPPPPPPRPTPTPTPTPSPMPSSLQAATPAQPITGKLHHVSVSGALSQTDVRRAILRIEPSLRRCTASAQGTAQVRFTVDDSRRPHGLSGSGVPNATLSCLISAFGTARMEVAPDVGDAEVVVDILFSSST